MAIGIGRRLFVAGISGTAIGLPLGALAQGSDRVRNIGVVMPMAQNDPARLPRVAALQDTLHQLRWTVGQSISIDYRWGAADANRFRSFASEMVSRSPEVVLVTGNVAAI